MVLDMPAIRARRSSGGARRLGATIGCRSASQRAVSDIGLSTSGRTVPVSAYFSRLLVGLALACIWG